MLHRLPIVLYDNLEHLNRNSVYIITPSQIYIQMVENMRNELEISDINMGTVEEYFDNCIGKYPGHTAGEYGKISKRRKVSLDAERYIYSKECIYDICMFFNKYCQNDELALDKAVDILNVKKQNRNNQYYSQIINNQLLLAQDIINKNRIVIERYFKSIILVLDLMKILSKSLKNRKKEVMYEISKRIKREEDIIVSLKKEISELDPEKNVRTIKQRNSGIDASKKTIFNLQEEQKKAELDD